MESCVSLQHKASASRLNVCVGIMSNLEQQVPYLMYGHLLREVTQAGQEEPGMLCRCQV